MKKKTLPSVALIVALFIIVPSALLTMITSPVHSYTIRATNPNKLATHQWIATKAIQVLERANYHAEAEFFRDYKAELMKGTLDADIDGGQFSIAGKEVDRNAFSHFFNPKTKEGLRTDPKWVPKWIAKMGNHFVSGYASMVLGPGLPATDMCDWHYEEARQIMQMAESHGSIDHESLKRKSMHALGYSEHFIADATVPQHVTDCGAERGSDCRHSEYERFVQDMVIETWEDGVDDVNLPSEIIYDPTMTPSDYVMKAAAMSAPHLDDARSGEPERMLRIARPMVKLSLQLVAGLYKRFYDQWASENASVVLVRIDRLTERKGRRCLGNKCWNDRSGNIEGSKIWNTFNDADFMPEVQIDGHRPEIRGYTVGIEDVKPRSGYDANGWTFVKRVSRLHGSVNVKVCIWDVKQISGKKTKLVDINSSQGHHQKCVHIRHRLQSIQHERSTGCDANGRCYKAADIRFTVSSVFPIDDDVRRNMQDDVRQNKQDDVSSNSQQISGRGNNDSGLPVEVTDC